MDALLGISLSNAVAATVLAFIAAAAGLVCRRPAVAHALWLLVLVKLITPPVVSIPIHWTPGMPAAAAPCPGERVQPEPPALPVPAPVPAGDAVEAEPAVREAQEAPAAADLPAMPPPIRDAPSRIAAAAEAAEPQLPPLPWTQSLLAVWGAGSAGWFSLAGLRAYRFGRLLRFARPAPAWLREQAEEMAGRLGLGPCPEVWLLPGRVSPMLWAAGGSPRLLLPAGLLHRLSAEQRATLLAHELAHLRRRDHWVRTLEAAVTGLYWWHPVVWWARRGLREAEEQCCDAWVLWALPGTARAYALALVETVDFLSEARTALPQGASGIGHVHDLRRRITMIMRGATPRRLSWAGGLVVLTLAAVLLPLLPTWAQDRAGDRATDKPADPAKRADDDKQRADELQRARVELKQMAAEIEQMKAQLDVAQANLEQAGARFKAAKARVDGLEAKGSGRTTIIEIKTPDGNVKTIEVPAGSKVIGVEQEKRFTFTRDNRDAKEWGQAQPGQPGNTEQRLADLEKKFKELTQQMDDLRKQLKQKPTSFWPATPAVPATPAAPAPELAPVAPDTKPALPPPPAAAPPAPRRP